MVEIEPSPASRMPTEQTIKQLALEMLEDISVLYSRTLRAIQIALMDQTIDDDLKQNFHSYTSNVVTLYKMLKPKIQSLGADSQKKYEDLEVLDEYVQFMLSAEIILDIEEMAFFFQLFNQLEDKCRELCDTLGYTRDIMPK